MRMLTFRSLVRYGILGIPLAFAGLPVYVHVPKFYADTFHIDLEMLGFFLLGLRFFDAVSDPVIGYLSDRWHRHHRLIMSGGAFLLMAGYAALFNPPDEKAFPPLFWLAGCLAVVYFSFSVLMINYYGMGADLGRGYHDHTRIAGFREGSMLLGVLLASILPSVLRAHFDTRTAFSIFGFTLAPILLVCAIACFSLPVPERQSQEAGGSAFFGLLRDARLRWLLLIGLFNAIPTAITSTLFLFFVTDILGAEKYSGPLLALYFLSAAGGMPLWVLLSRRFGKKFCLVTAMITAIICFVWAVTLGAGDVGSFAIICVLSGMTIGADAMMLPAMLGDALMSKRQSTASVFGLWNFISKLAMAGAAGIVLPLLSAAGYVSSGHNSGESLHALSYCYALAPCAFKVIAVLMLYLSPLDRERKAASPF